MVEEINVRLYITGGNEDKNLKKTVFVARIVSLDSSVPNAVLIRIERQNKQ